MQQASGFAFNHHTTNSFPKYSAMKHPAFILFSCIVLLTGVLQESCNLKMIDDVECADFKVSFSYVKDTSPCYPPCEIKFDSKIEGGTARQFDWTFGDGNTSNQEDPTNIYESPGSKPVRFQATSADGCEASDTTTIVIEDLSAQLPVAKFAPEDTTGTAHFTVKFRNLSSSVTTPEHHWDFGDPGSGANTSTAVEPQHTYEKAGTYTVVLTVTNAIGSSKDTGTVTVKPRTFVHSEDIDPVNSFERAILVDEDAKGNFAVISTNDKAIWISKFDYDGTLLSSPQKVSVGADFPTQSIHSGKKVDDGYALTGIGQYVNASNPGPPNDDFFFLKVSSDLVQEHAENYFFIGDDDSESAYGICQATTGGGYLLCGNKFDGTQKGAMFLKLTSTYNRDGDPKILYGSDLNQTAYDVQPTSTGFVALARIKNSVSGQYEACIFQLTNSLNTAGDPVFLGNFVPESLVKISDSSFVVIGNNLGNARIVKAGFGGGSPIEVVFTGITLKRGLITSDNELAVVGHTTSVANPEPRLYKRKSTDLSPIWGGDDLSPVNPFGEAHSIMQTADNGFIIGGRDTQGRTLLLRTNAEGKIE